MSAPSYTSNFDGNRILRFLVFASAFWAVALLVAILFINPYGVSPLAVSSSLLNEIKPLRRDIDRQIKPIEVWTKQPETIFLGTSRIHQSIDPDLLAGTSYYKSYNASVPAVSLSRNLDYLMAYKDRSNGINTVFVELFVYNFLGQGQDRSPVRFEEAVSDFFRLTASLDALISAIKTLSYNIVSGEISYQISQDGHFIYPSTHNPAGPFAGFPKGMIDLYRQNSTGGYVLSEDALASVREINQYSNENNIELIWLLTPNHAYFDYFIEITDEWEVVIQWLTQVTANATVYSFSQPNNWVYEKVSKDMKYWYDPFHFSMNFGKGMLASIVGEGTDELPGNFMLKLTPELVKSHVAQRRIAINEWAKKNPEESNAIRMSYLNYLSEKSGGTE